MTRPFSWFRPREEVRETTKQDARRPAMHDLTDGMVCNIDLTRGLFRNTYPGMKLAGSLAYAPIAHPVAFMGVPTPKAEDDAVQETLDAIVAAMTKRMTSLHITVPRDGTAWVWPKYDAKGGRLVWEFLPDESVVDIVKSPDTQEIQAIYTDEEFKIVTGENLFTFARRKRVFTRQTISVKWTQVGTLGADLMDKTTRNVLGILPIPFANMPDADESRGHSDYERILYDLKDYHDIDYARSEILTKFKPKMVQEVSDPKAWLANNGYDSLCDVDPWSIDFVVNITGKEKTTFETAKGATDSYEKALENKYWKLVEGSGIPEIFWGLQAAGNQASVDDQRQAMVRYVEMKRTQLNDSYTALFRASLALLAIAGVGVSGDFKMQWNRLSSISEAVKATIFSNFAQGLSAIIKAGGITKQQTYNLWMANYPEATEATFDEFLANYGGAVAE
jgi:hypothetical protein